MILKAKERGSGTQLARYLLSMRENDHVELHEVRGFVSDDLREAFGEADAIARGTKCENHLFSMSLNPPEGAHKSAEDFEDAAARIEQKLGLENQPRAIVFHEKDGRRHAHVVWSRIDTQHMRAINLPHFKTKLRDVSRKLYLDHGWDMPRGLQDRILRDPLSFTHSEWQQARRMGLDPREIKAVIKECWQASDSKASFEQALKKRGFWLAKGDQRSFVAVDYRGGVYSLSKATKDKKKDFEARLGKPDTLPSVEQVKADIADGMTEKLRAFIKDAERDTKRRLATLDFRKAEMNARHHVARQELVESQDRRWKAETKRRAERLPKGMSGLWHRVTGRYGAIKAQNEQEALEAIRRDSAEKDTLIAKQIDQRHALQQDIKAQRAIARDELMRLRGDVYRYRQHEQESDNKAERQRERQAEERQQRQNRRPRHERHFDP